VRGRKIDVLFAPKDLCVASWKMMSQSSEGRDKGGLIAGQSENGSQQYKP
jgi:hypothetical protein